MSSPASVAAIHAHPGSLTICSAPATPRAPHRRAAAPHGACPASPARLARPRSSCQASPAVHLHVDLLIRTLRCFGGRAACVLVRPGRFPAFWLRIAGRDRTDDLNLDVLDAVCLLMSRRVPMVLLDHPAADSDAALRQLVADEDG